MKPAAKAVLLTLAVFAAILGLGFLGEALATLTNGASHWAFAAAFFLFVLWFSYVAFKEADAPVDEVEPQGFEQLVGVVVRERYHQIALGYDAEHDATNDRGQLADAAACYAWNATHPCPDDLAPMAWPWEAESWNPTTPRRDLIKAAALILAEIERLDRVRV